MIDCDVHCAPAAWTALEPYLTSSWLQFIEDASIRLSNYRPVGGLSALPEQYPTLAPTSVTAEEREAGVFGPASGYEDLQSRYLERSDARVVVLNCLTMFEAYRNPHFQAGLAAAVNDWLRYDWFDRDERLRASLVVPWTDPEGALSEIERVGEDPRFVQVLLPVRAPSLWGQKAHHAIHDAAVERGLAVALHAWGVEGRAPSPSGFAESYLEDYLSNATVAQQQLISFIAEGVFERLPDLRLVILECGFAWLPPLLWRMDKEWKGLWPEVPWVKELPSAYVQRNVRITTEPAGLGGASAEEIAELVEMTGPARLMYASDHPHDHGRTGQRLLEAVDDRVRAMLLEGNAQSFYGLPALV